MMRSRFVLVSLLTAVVCLPAPAQERRVIPVTVVDKEGKIVEGLTASNFRAEFRGRQVEIKSADLRVSPKKIAILLDSSGSLKNQTGENGLWSIVERLVLRWTGPNEVALISFASEQYLDMDFSRDVTGLQEKIIELSKTQRQRGGTALYDVIYVASNHTGGDESGGKVLYVISDGKDNISRTKEEDARDRALAQEVRVYLLCTIPSARTCGSLPSDTGGMTIFPPESGVVSFEEILESASGINETMFRHYRVDIGLLKSVDRRRKWKLEVVDANGKKMKGVTVHSRDT